MKVWGHLEGLRAVAYARFIEGAGEWGSRTGMEDLLVLRGEVVGQTGRDASFDLPVEGKLAEKFTGKGSVTQNDNEQLIWLRWV